MSGWVEAKLRGRVRGTARIVTLLVLAWSLSGSAHFMVKYHPHQNVYFNALTGPDEKGFDLDYWGLSYRQALEYILENDTRETIRMHTQNSPGWKNLLILPKRERSRLEYVGDAEQADYFLGNYRSMLGEYPYEHKYYSIKVNGAEIMVVYKL